MKKLILATVLTGLMGVSVALAIPSSGTITVAGSPLEYSDGGQFTATVSGYPSFQTYCIEINHEFSLGGTYNYTLGQATHGIPPAGAAPFLNLGTAWLYSQFEANALGILNITTTVQAGELQAALWYFQGQGVNANGAFSGLGFGDGLPGANAYTDAAIAALGGGALGLANAITASGGAYGVDIIQSSSTGANGVVTPAQDWLYESVPSVPDGGATVMLLGIGLMSLVLVSRRFAVAR
jgi:hypothetical protein